MNPHPLGYHQILAQIALEHPNGGVDLQAEVARRFMDTGDVIQIPGPPMATSPNPPEDEPDYSGGTTPSEKAGMAQAGPVNPNTVAVADPTEGLPITQPLPPTGDIHSPGWTPDGPPGIPSVPIAKQPPPPAKAAPRGTGGGQPAESADDQKYDAASGDKIQSLEDQVDVAGQRSDQAGPEQRDIANQQQAMLNKSNAFNDDIQQTELRLGQKQEDLINQYANATVDPHRYWNSLDTGHQILAGISLFLGGGGDASPVVSAINRDVQLQAQQIERTGKAAGMVGELIDHYRGMGLDNRQATQMAVNTASEIGKQRAIATAAQFAKPEAGAALGAAIADVTQNGIVGKMNLHNVASQVAEHRASAYNQSVQGQQGAFNLGQSKKYADWAQRLGLPPGASMANQVSDSSGNLGFAPDDKTAAAYNTETLPSQQLLQTLNDIKQKRSQGVIATQGDLEALRGRLEQNLAAMGETKESTRNQAIFKGMSGDPTQLYHILPGSDWDKHLRSLQQIATNNIETSKKVHPGIRFLQAPQVGDKPRY